MRKVIGGCLAAVALIAGAPSNAADLPAGLPPAKAPYAAPAYNWYGFFVGIHGGYLWGGHATTITGTPALPVGVVSSIEPDPSGFIGGIHWGTNWQSGRWVYGFDSDLSFTDIKGTQTVVSAGVTNSAEEKLSWFGTSRVRLGYTLQDNLLLYGTGGLAGGTARLTLSHLPGLTGVSGRDNLWGWALGAGLEYGMGPWSLRFDYLHFDLGNASFSYVPTGGVVATATTKVAGDIVRGGISYRFNWTPWELIFGRR
jgi:outer membrane immunogenic protein